MKLSLKARLVDYLKRRGDWVASGDLQRLVTTHTKHTASNATRRLRECVEEGTLEVTHRSRNGVNHAYYKYLKDAPKTSPRASQGQIDPIKWFDELDKPLQTNGHIELRNGVPTYVI